ncbi:uncharacterized protein B0H18DRAFT_956557 [Fomitopsis serialis]|uniref:uncharacterized protein n=1 Tax=Fomitopsis serialis TaxID=139415 RepID=UPI002007E789|nr:uncharacterized protein B0H18DRAFT_956557 [Neoantrodia serialis]KAH9921598.1 hypothetical protein B0H18DRAFT_956557 [Neoantrodia serialis]
MYMNTSQFIQEGGFPDEDVSTDSVDPGLNRGYAYFVEETEYKAHLKTHDKGEKVEKSTCNSHDAVKLANMRGSNGTAASGVGTVECVRHDMKRPCSVGDLQKGERYVNMDYLFASSLRQHTTTRVVVSYDIACQWSVNLWQRMLQYDFDWDVDRRTITFLIPKFHLPAHQESCHTKYSFHFIKHVGRTDGEAVERGWAAVNGFSGSTKEMGPGSRRDVLDDAFGDYNWRKVVQLLIIDVSVAKTLFDRVKTAVEERSKQVAEFQDLTHVTNPTHIAEWTQQVEAWEDGADYNPFVATRRAISLASVRLSLAEEESAAIESGDLVLLHGDVSPSMLIIAGLEIEELQRRLQRDAASIGTDGTDTQRAEIVRRRSNLKLRINAWRGYQDLYMPGVLRLRSADDSDAPLQPENTPLYLPSALVGNPLVAPTPSLKEIERRLRHAQANDTLDQLRRHLRARSHLYMVKDRDVRGQRYNTRSQTYIKTVEARVQADAARYRVAHSALLAMDPPDEHGWQKYFRPLEQNDVRGMKDPKMHGSQREEGHCPGYGGRPRSPAVMTMTTTMTRRIMKLCASNGANRGRALIAGARNAIFFKRKCDVL